MTSSRTKNKSPAKAAPQSEPVKRAATGESGRIQSLIRAAAILDAVARQPEGISLAQLSAEVGLHNSTAFHLIQTLVNLDFLTQGPDNRRYRMGSRIFALAAGALNDNTLLSLATPLLERLSAETGEAAHLAVRSRHEIIVIARTAASGLLQLAGHPGATRPAHATAIGKMLLAAMPIGELERVLETLPLPRLTPNTITDQATLRAELDEVRRTGLAHDNCELDADVRCVAVAVHDFAERCVAAMGISGPAWRLSAQALKQKSRQLSAAAAELSALIGFNGSDKAA
jgi:DNA-binding IclR family transcriptional regulator